VSRKGCGDFLKCGDGALVLLDGGYLGGTFRDQSPRQPAGPRAYLDDVVAGQRTRGPRDPSREIEIEQEILPEPLRAERPWRAITSRNGGRGSFMKASSVRSWP
jgi:hypothetical protein